MHERASGILLHISSLPSKYGIGDLGPEAIRFVDWLVKAGQSYWQILPLNPTDAGSDHSPYFSISAFAFNPLLISPDQLIRDGYICETDLGTIPENKTHQVDHKSVAVFKNRMFDIAYTRFAESDSHPEFVQFCREHACWLDSFALFVALKDNFSGNVWTDWPTDYRDRDAVALEAARSCLSSKIEKVKFLQFLFYEQWQRLRGYCHKRGIQIMGDIPIYVSLDSADVWAHSELFKLDKEKRPVYVSGCPPDYFSETGQLWGNPVYNWEVLESKGFSWWIDRVRHNIALFDFTRIDHFRGLVGYWEVAAGEETAMNGEWIPAPAVALLTALRKSCHSLPIFAEDLGVITQDVVDVMFQFDLPGMKVLQFGFSGSLDNNPYTPHNVPQNSVLYTGTHDNNTTRGWFERDAREDEKQNLFGYIGYAFDADTAADKLIGLALESPADTVVIPIQDILNLDGAHRMNNPAIIGGNWRWKLLPDLIQPGHAELMRDRVKKSGRLSR